MSADTVSWIAGNRIGWEHYYVDESGAPVDISATTGVTLHIRMPDTTQLTDTGHYDAASPNKNRVYCITDKITNAHMGENLSLDRTAPVWGEFETVMPGEPLSRWSPKKVLPVSKSMT